MEDFRDKAGNIHGDGETVVAKSEGNGEEAPYVEEVF